MCKIVVREIVSGPVAREIPKKNGEGSFTAYRVEAKASVDMGDGEGFKKGLATIETTNTKIRDRMVAADGHEFEAHRLNLSGGTVFAVKTADNPGFSFPRRSGGSYGAPARSDRQVALEYAVGLERARQCAPDEVPSAEQILKTAEQFLGFLEGRS